MVRRLKRRAKPTDVGLAILTGIVVTAALWSALTGFVLHERRQTVEDAHLRTSMQVHAFSEGVARSIDSAILANTAIGNQLALGLPADGEATRSAIAQTATSLPFLRGLGIFDAQGLVIGGTELAAINRVIDLRALGTLPAVDQNRLGEAVPAGSLLDLVPSSSPQTTAPGVGFLPLLRTVQLPSGQRVHLIAMLDGHAFAAVQRDMMSDSSMLATLASSDGRLIASTAVTSRAAASSIKDVPLFRGLLQKQAQGGWTGAGVRGTEQIASFSAIAGHPLVAMVEISQHDAMADWLKKERLLIIAGLMLTLLTAGGTWIVVRSLRARMAARIEIDAAHLRASQRETELTVTLKSLQELIFRTDANGAITFVNNHWMPVMGTPVETAQGERPWELVLARDRDTVWDLFATRPGLEARRAQASLVIARGVVRTFDFSVTPLQHEGVVTGFAGSAIDVTERVAAERQLEAQLAFTRLVMELSPLPKSVVSMKGRHLIVNKAWEGFTGQQSGDIAFETQGGSEQATPRPLFEARDRKLLAPGEPLRYETTVKHRDGSTRDVMVNKVMLHGPDGRPAGILCVFMDISEFRDAERATREARDIAEEASRAKSEFIANISHELRTPLQSIIGFSELGQMRARPNERMTAMFDDIHGAGQRMLTLVNDLLDVSKIDSTVGAIHLESNDLRGLVRGVIRELHPLLAARRLQLVTHLPDEPMLARVDPPRFQQVVRNVLANAIKFSPAGSRIDLVGDHTPSGELRLVLRDQGPGIPVAELETIFEAFVQSSNTKDGSGGTGLGLAICRKIIDAHGGRIHGENRPEGGAAFHVVLPARPAPTIDESEPESEAAATCRLAA